MRRLPALLSAAVVSLGTLAATAPARAADPPDLPLTGVVDMQVDPAHGHVFLTSGGGSNKLVVAGADGSLQQTLNLAGPSGMVLSPDGSHLYVALTDGDGIAVVDTSDLAYRVLHTGPGTCPSTLAMSAGLLWYGYGCSGYGGGLGAIDPVTGRNTPALAAPRFSYPPRLASSTGHPGLLMAMDPWSSSTDLYELHATGGSKPALRVVTSRELDDGSPSAIEVHGDDVLAAGGREVQSYALSDLSGDAVYPTGSYAVDVDARDDGLLAIGTRTGDEVDVSLYQPEDADPVRTYDVGTGTPSDETQLVAFGRNVLYVVTADTYHEHVQLRAVTPPLEADLSVGTDRHQYDVGDTVSVTAHLGSTATGREVRLYETVDGARHLLTIGTAFEGTVSTTADVRTNATFSAVFPGDTEYSSRVATLEVVVRAGLTSSVHGAYGHSGVYALYHRGRHASTSVKVTPAHGGQCVRFRVENLDAHRHWHTVSLRCATLGSTGRATRVVQAWNTVGTRLRTRAEWPGDADNAAATGQWEYARFTR